MPHVAQRGRGRRTMNEINMVPFIDVMLVLLIIFMVTAPLMNLGVDIQLPQSAAKAIQNDKEPAIVSVDAQGQLSLTLGTSEREAIDADTLVKKVSAFVRENPQVPVLVAGDQRADYGKIYQAMVLLRSAGVPKVGLMSQPVQADAPDNRAR
jgi:biopolymer transport protein TolR